jgi:hypothetical protein
MTVHRTLPAMALLHASRAASATRAFQHQAPSAGPPTTRVLGFFGRAAGISIWFVGRMRLFLVSPPDEYSPLGGAAEFLDY